MELRSEAVWDAATLHVWREDVKISPCRTAQRIPNTFVFFKSYCDSEKMIKPHVTTTATMTTVTNQPIST